MKTSQLIALFFAALAFVVIVAEATSSDSDGMKSGCTSQVILNVECQRCFSECVREYSYGIGTCISEQTCNCVYDCSFSPPKASPPPQLP
uniref:Knottin scorpion toxin-like domain-containing protein n=1 Tax=Oryza brachyantha TaxID=4533 RepID=J3LHL3_ORYBR